MPDGGESGLSSGRGVLRNNEMDDETAVEAEEVEIILEPTGDRIDKALATVYPDMSRAQWQRLIKEGAVTLDDEPVKAKLKVEEPLTVVVQIPATAETELIAEDIPLDILYEDADMLVINKPAGMVVHPAVGHERGTLVNAVLYHCGAELNVSHEKRPGIVHRLDKDTSGVIVVAKHDHAVDYLQKQFKARTIKKEYLALVEGQIQPESALIDAPIGRDPRQRKKMTVIRPNSSATSRPAQTQYKLEAHYDDFSLVRCFPHTGRTHQIRVHLAYIGYPIVGDDVYGRRKQRLKLNRHYLHAAKITFQRPSDGEPLSFEAPLPPELQGILDQLS